MNNKGQGAIIAMAIGAILLVVVLGVIFSTLSDQVSDTAVTEQVFAATNGTCVRLTANCYVGGTLTVVNSTSNTVDATGNFSECGTSGDIFGALPNIIDGGLDGANHNASYSERSCAFITSGITRTLVNLIPVLLAIVILVFILGFVALRK